MAETLSDRIKRRQITRTRKDIADWKRALNAAEAVTNPRFYLLQDIYSEAMDDALLSSQVSNRFEVTASAPFELVDNGGNVNDEQTAMLQSFSFIQDLFRHILDSELYGYSIVELANRADGTPDITLILRRNIDPVFGRFYPDAYHPSYIEYREMAEYGKFVLEFNAGHLGILNKTIPHVLFKKFAQSCWSELCEIYGIPPRFIKTNTTDPEMLERAEKMVTDMGAAAGFVIDQTEEFGFAQGASTNGDVYNNLITLCKQEISMLICGAIIGQDTVNGNYSKEESNKETLDALIKSDKRMVEQYMNSVVLPAFRNIGWMPASDGLKFRFSAVEDTDQLWERMIAVLPYKDVDSEWMEEKFGIPVKDKQTPDFGMSQNSALSFFV
jgi:phage gp29-like protein